MRFLVITLFYFLFFSSIVNAQLMPSFTYADGYNICGQSVLNVEIKNTGSLSVGPIISEYDLNTYMHVDSAWTEVQNHFLNITGNKIRFVFDTLLEAQGSIFFHLKMSTAGACSLVSCSDAYQSIDNLQLKYNSKTEVSQNKQTLKSPCLTYDENLFDKRLYSAFIGDTITRKIVLLNTGGGKFDGFLEVMDVFGAYVEVDTIYSNFSGYRITSSININDSTRIFQAKFSNVKKGDSISIFEKVIIKRCIDEDFGKSSIYINWSCDSNLCKKITPYPIIAQVLKNNKKPEIIITKVITPESNCLNSKSKNTYVIKNKGLRPAIDLRFELAPENLNTYTYLDKTSLKLDDTTGLVLKNSFITPLIPAVPEPFSYEHSCIIPNPLKKWNFTIESLIPNDSFIVEYETYHCCPGIDTTDQEIFFETWLLNVEYTDQCRDDTFSTASSQDPNTSVLFRQFYEPIITNMNGFAQDTSTFEIFNTEFSTGFYRMNADSAAFKIILKVDTGLVFIPNTIKITSIYGQSLIADKVDLITGGLADGYKDTMLAATFILPDIFRLDPIYFARFIRNSSVKFELYPECPAKEPTSRFSQEIYFIPDLNCPGACEILLNTVTTEIAVHCPGCIFPGWICNYFKATRLTLGEQDNDNDRLPDYIPYTEADKNLIKFNRCIPGDIIETELNAFLQDGDPVTGRNMQQLENNGANSINFKYSYLSSTFSYGKLFKLNYVQVIITDIDKSSIPSGSDTILLPVSTVIKIDNPVDSLTDSEIFYNFSLDTLQKYGLPTSYKYEPFDQIKIISNFTIQEFSDHYRTNPPTEKDPWLILESGSLQIMTYSHLLYLTGAKDIPGDSDIEANAYKNNPSALDSNMIYWCEGYGGASTLIGRGKIVAINLPGDVQCIAQGNVGISMSPAAGIFRNPFPFEYRNFLNIDSLLVNVPTGYRFTDWTISNSIDRPDGYLEFESCTVVDTLNGIDEDGPFISINIKNLYDKVIQFNTSNCLDKLMYGDEYISTTIAFNVVPDCNLPSHRFYYDSPRLYYHILPKNVAYIYQIPNSPSIDKLNAKLHLTPITNEALVSKKTFCYPINLEETNGNNADYSFIKINSLNHKILLESLEEIETNEIFFPDSTGLFLLGTTEGNSIRQFKLCLSNICGKVVSKDSLLFIYGHDCNQYPNSTFSNICKFDSVMHYALPSNLSVQSFLDAPSNIQMCQPFTISYDYQFTGLGGIDNLILKLYNKITEGVKIVSGSMEINGTTAGITQTYDSSSASFNLGSVVNTIYPQGLKSGDDIKLFLTFNTDCQYSGLDISSQLILITSSCDTITDDTLNYTPATLTGYPVSDNKSITAVFTEFKNTGGETTVTIQVHNNSLKPSVNKTNIAYFLPPGFSFAGSLSPTPSPLVSATAVSWVLNPGIVPSGFQKLVFKLNYEPITCDSLKFEIQMGDISQGCSGVPCIKKDSSFYFKEFVKCYPCPPFLKKEDRCKGLPIFNTLHWQNEGHFYCPDVYNYLYSVYYSPTISGSYKLIHQTQDTTFIHDSISSYEGCYYVTIIDTAGILSEKSNIVCNTNCNDQFKCQDLFIANFFTPNGDNLNDKFLVTGAYTELKLEVYNRWGKLVYKSDNYKNDWGGENLATGLYFRYIFIDGSEEACIGWVQIEK